MILLYAGRLPDENDFPAANEQFVAEQVERVLRDLMPRLVVGSAAAGTDIIVLERTLGLGLEARAFIAGTKEEFARSSVEGSGAGWVERYEALLANGRVEVVEVPRVRSNDDASYRAVTDAIWSTIAEEGDSAVVLTVSRRREGGGHTEELAQRQEEHGGEVVTIDPTVGRG